MARFDNQIALGNMLDAAGASATGFQAIDV